jgi:hypothetical protein
MGAGRRDCFGVASKPSGGGQSSVSNQHSLTHSPGRLRSLVPLVPWMLSHGIKHSRGPAATIYGKVQSTCTNWLSMAIPIAMQYRY